MRAQSGLGPPFPATPVPPLSVGVIPYTPIPTPYRFAPLPRWEGSGHNVDFGVSTPELAWGAVRELTGLGHFKSTRPS